jgi:hypothetical protein
MAFQRTRRPSLRSGRSLRSLGSPLNAYPLGGANPARRSDVDRQRTSRDDAVVSTLSAACLRTHERMADVPLECE